MIERFFKVKGWEHKVINILIDLPEGDRVVLLTDFKEGIETAELFSRHVVVALLHIVVLRVVGLKVLVCFNLYQTCFHQVAPNHCSEQRWHTRLYQRVQIKEQLVALFFPFAAHYQREDVQLGLTLHHGLREYFALPLHVSSLFDHLGEHVADKRRVITFESGSIDCQRDFIDILGLADVGLVKLKRIGNVFDYTCKVSLRAYEINPCQPLVSLKLVKSIVLYSLLVDVPDLFEAEEYLFYEWSLFALQF